MIHPVRNVYITQTYGWTAYALWLRAEGSHAYDVFRGIHGGVDYGISQPVIGPAKGIVTLSRDDNGWGNRIDIKLDDYPDISALLCHNARNYVGVGSRVNEGQDIAQMGSTGASTGTHVHFSLYKGVYAGSNTQWLNPLDYINKDNNMDYVSKDQNYWMNTGNGEIIKIWNPTAKYYIFNADSADDGTREILSKMVFGDHWVNSGKINEITAGKTRVANLSDLYRK
jgi:hypothetical protein